MSANPSLLLSFDGFQIILSNLSKISTYILQILLKNSSIAVFLGHLNAQVVYLTSHVVLDLLISRVIRIYSLSTSYSVLSALISSAAHCVHRFLSYFVYLSTPTVIFHCNQTVVYRNFLS